MRHLRLTVLRQFFRFARDRKVILADPTMGLVNTIDPKLVATAFGMKPESVMYYLADHVDDGRLPASS